MPIYTIKIKPELRTINLNPAFFYYTKHAKLTKSAHIVHEVIILKSPIAKLMWVNRVFIKGGAGTFHAGDTDSGLIYGNLLEKLSEKKFPQTMIPTPYQLLFPKKTYLNILKLFICLYDS